MRLPEVLRHGWEERVSALRNVPAVLRMFWDSAPTSVALSLVFRLITSLVPLGILLTTRLIINAVVAHVARHEELPQHFWCWWWPPFSWRDFRWCSRAQSTTSTRYSPPAS